MTLTRVVPILEPFGRMSPIGIMSRRQVLRDTLLGGSRTSQELYFLCCHIVVRVHLLSVAEIFPDNRRKVVAKAIDELPTSMIILITSVVKLTLVHFFIKHLLVSMRKAGVVKTAQK